MSDDYYNDGPSFAQMFLGEDTHVAASTKFTIYDNAGQITDEVTVNFSGGSHSWGAWEVAANTQINQYLNHMNASGGVVDGGQAYRYIELVYGSDGMTWGDPEGIKLYFDEHLTAPNIDAYFVSPEDAYHERDNMAANYAPKVTLTHTGSQHSEEWYAEMFAPTQSFVEGTGDDNDVYTAFDISDISRSAYDDLDLIKVLVRFTVMS